MKYEIKNRSDYIGGSEIYDIVSDRFLSVAKAKLSPSDYQSSAMTYGNEREGAIRDYVSKKYGLDFQPAEIVGGQVEGLQLVGHLDGLAIDGPTATILEIKTTASDTTALVIKGEAHYQLAFYKMLICETKPEIEKVKTVLATEIDGELEIIEPDTLPSTKIINSKLKEFAKFYKIYRNGELTKESNDSQELAKYSDVLDRFFELENQVKKIKEQIKEQMNEQGIIELKVQDYKFTLSQTKETEILDTAKAKELLGDKAPMKKEGREHPPINQKGDKKMNLFDKNLEIEKREAQIKFAEKIKKMATKKTVPKTIKCKCGDTKVISYNCYIHEEKQIDKDTAYFEVVCNCEMCGIVSREFKAVRKYKNGK